MVVGLISGFDLKLATPECLPNVEYYRASVNLHDDITAVLPYLNGELEGADYNHDAKILLWSSGDKKYAFRPREIAIAPVQDREEAEKLALIILQTVNEIWNRKDSIEPKFEGKKPPPNVLDIYKLLPRTNCKKCGYLSCMAFAAAVRKDPEKSKLCPFIQNTFPFK